MKKILSISHTDLDGYGAQYIVSKALRNYDVSFINLDYSDVLAYFQETDFTVYNEVVITDLNLSSLIIDIIKKHIDAGVNFTVIDHHETNGVDGLNWYNLDKTCSAALGAYNYYFIDEYGNIDKGSEKLQEFAQLVSIYDIWQTTDSLFNKATFISDIVFSVPLVYKNSKRDFMFSLFDTFISENWIKYPVQDIEKWYIDFLYSIDSASDMPSKQRVLLSEFPDFKLDVQNNQYTILGQVVSVVSIPSVNFQYLSHKYLEEVDPDAVLIKYSDRESGSVRSQNGKAVDIARELGGGGHKNAAGFGCTSEFLYSKLTRLEKI